MIWSASIDDPVLLLSTSSVAILLAFLKLIGMARPFYKMIEMLRLVLLGVSSFLLLTLTISFAFALAFMTLFVQDYSFMNFATVSFTIGDGAPVADQEGSSSQNPLILSDWTFRGTMTRVLFLFFTVISSVILVNLLIAILTDKYEEVFEQQEQTHQRMLASMIMDIEVLALQPPLFCKVLTATSEWMELTKDRLFSYSQSTKDAVQLTVCCVRTCCNRVSYYRAQQFSVVRNILYFCIPIVAASIDEMHTVEPTQARTIPREVYTAAYALLYLPCLHFWLMPWCIDSDYIEKALVGEEVGHAPLNNIIRCITVWSIVVGIIDCCVTMPFFFATLFYRTPSLFGNVYCIPGSVDNCLPFLVRRFSAGWIQPLRGRLPHWTNKAYWQSKSSNPISWWTRGLWWSLLVFCPLLAVFGVAGLVVWLLWVLVISLQWFFLKKGELSLHPNVLLLIPATILFLLAVMYYFTEAGLAFCFVVIILTDACLGNMAIDPSAKLPRFLVLFEGEEKVVDRMDEQAASGDNGSTSREWSGTMWSIKKQLSSVINKQVSRIEQRIDNIDRQLSMIRR